MPNLIITASDSTSALWLGRILDSLTILFPQASQIAFGLYLGLMLWGGPWLHGRSFRMPFSC